MSKVTVVSRPNRIVIASKGVQGAPGPTGPQGEQGLQGPKGDTGDVTPEAIAARDAAQEAALTASTAASTATGAASSASGSASAASTAAGTATGAASAASGSASAAAASANLAEQARLLGATIGFATKADMDASLAHAAGTLALVTSDATAANNGTYRKTGASGSGAWVQSADRVTGLEQEISKVSNAAGKINGWPDPFFREAVPGQAFFGRPRWMGHTWNSHDYSALEVVDNPIFDGHALRKAVSGFGANVGPVIYADELGVTEGGTYTIRALCIANGATGTFAARALSATNDWLGSTLEYTFPAGASPVLATLTGAVIEGTERWRIAPRAADGGTITILALWAYRGDPSDGPAWPSLESVRGDYRLAELTERVEHTEDAAGAALYAVTLYDRVVSDSESVEIAGSAYSTVARDLPFMGWGEIYSPAGVSFNAVRVMQVSRSPAATAHWQTLTAIVRGGDTPTAAAAPILAIGSVRVRPDLDTLDAVMIPLRDPVTGEIVTLSDASFGGNNYLLAVFARTEDGDRAAMGEPRGTLPNSAGQSYYYASTQNNPEGGPWAVNAGNARIGFQHLLLTNPRVEDEFRPSQDFAAALASEATPAAPDMILPPAIFAVQGAEANVYFDNLLMQDAADYLFDVDGVSVGAHQNERWTWTPSAAVASGSITVSVHDRRTGQRLVSGVSQIRAAASNAGSGTTKKCIFVGDSLINAGTITQTVLDNADVMGVSLLGTRGAGANLHEGRGGWSIANYTSNYSDPTAGVNPFWIGGAVNFAGYLAANTIDVPDWVFIHLGINDVFGQTSDVGAVAAASDAFDRLDILISSIKAAGAGVKIGLMIPTPPARDQDAFGASYGVGQTRWRFKRNILIWSRALITRYAGQEASRVYIVPSNTALDTTNNVSRAASAPINSRTSKTAERQNNGVHPAAEGYRQIGDAVWAFLKFYASE